jgi:hypothetical protein
VKFLVLGNPENRRVSLFQEALSLEGQPPAHVVSWEAFLADPGVLDGLPDEPTLFRIDSAGENDAVERAFLKRGYENARNSGCRTISPARLDALTPSLGRIICPRQQHLGFETTLDELEGVLTRHPQWRCLAPPRDIRELFDKRQTSARWAALGIPVPDVLDGVIDTDALFARARERGWDELFVKMSASSSASCLAIVHLQGPTPTLHTTIEVARDGWFNTLKVRHVTAAPRVRELLDFLLAEGSQIERAIPKARLDDAYFDLRVLCIAKEPRFVVVRQNSHPITNLHLGGWRGELATLRARVQPPAWDAAMETARRVARCYDALQVGLDLMFEPDFVAHRVIEANAFGDLLPRLELDGANVWQWQIREALRPEGR